MVLYLVPNLIGPPGGIARYCQLVSRALLAAGRPVTVLALHDRPATGAHAASFPGMDYHVCDGSRPQFVMQAMRLAVEQRPGLVLVGHPHFAGLGDVVRRLANARMVVFVYGVDVWRPLRRPARFGLQRADRVISISHFTAQKAIEYNGVLSEKVRILHNCLDPAFDHPPACAPENGALSLLTVARISDSERYKGHEKVLGALPTLLTTFPQLVYDVVGDGEGRPRLEQLAAGLGVASAVHFHGMVTEEALRKLYARASVFIMPSTSEGFGFVFLEAMAHGLPVVAGNLDATPEVVVDGETGLLVDPISVEAIIAATARLLNDPPLRQRMGEAGRRRVQQVFGYEHFQNTLIGHLQEADIR